VTESARSIEEGPGSRGRSRWIRLGGALVAIALLADGAISIARLRDGLEAAGRALDDGRKALVDSRPGPAGELFGRAAKDSEQALDLLDRPSLTAAAHIPFASTELAAVRAIGEAEASLSEAGLRASDLLREGDGSSDSLFGRLFSKGRIDLAAFDELDAEIHRIDGLVRSAAERVRTAGPVRIDALATAISSARSALDDALSQLDRVTTTASLVSAFAGRSLPMRYLVVFESPSEARGSGGFPGIAAVLTMDKGRVSLSDPSSYASWGPIKSVKAPGWFDRYYGPFASDREWAQSNLAFHFPTTAQVMLSMYEQTHDVALDGLVAIDPVALEKILPSVGGSINAPELSTELDASNITAALLHDSYTQIADPVEQERFLVALVQRFFRLIRTAPIDGRTFAEGLGDAVASQHLKVYFEDDSMERDLAFVGGSSDFTRLGPNVQAWFHNNVSANKVDYFLTQELQTQVTVENGRAAVTTTMVYINDAPDGPRSVQLGPIQGFPDSPGTNRMHVNLIIPREAELERVSIDGDREEPALEMEAGFPRIFVPLIVPPGTTRSVSITYLLEIPPGAELEMAFVPQATVTPAAFKLLLDGRTLQAGILDRPTSVELG
jgi:hypothetical protein